MSDIVKGTGRLSFNESLVDNNGPTPSGHLPVSQATPTSTESTALTSTTVSYSSVTSTHETSPSVNNHKSPKVETNSTPDKVQPIRLLLLLILIFNIFLK